MVTGHARVGKMEIREIVYVLIIGLLLGGLYGLIAMGLSIQYGVARVLNVGHGEFIMLGAVGTWAMYTTLGINPFIAILITAPAAFIIGFLLHATVFRRLLKTSANQGIFESNSMLASFGILFIIQNIAVMIWEADIRAYSYLNMPVNILGEDYGANRLAVLGVAIALGLAFYFFLTYTRLGKAIRAAAQDATTASLMGININLVLAICFGIGAILAAIAGVLISMVYPVHPNMGLEYTIIAIIVVVLGGLGSIPGAFIGGILLGIIGSAVSFFEPGLALASYYLLFIFLLLVRPKGLFGK